MSKYYKVLDSFTFEGKLVSYIMAGALYLELNNPLIVEYREGEWIQPKVIGSRLFVFDSVKSVLAFLGPHYNQYRLEVWEVEAKKAQKEEEIIWWWALPELSANDLRDFWSLEFSTPDLLDNAPKGTYSCTSLKLIRRLTRKEIERKI